MILLCLLLGLSLIGLVWAVCEVGRQPKHQMCEACGKLSNQGPLCWNCEQGQYSPD